MTLADFEILPGIVVSNEDPLNQGRVKASSPGLFDTNTMDIDDMIWINPFCMIGYQSFSKLELGSKIWILHNEKNYFEYWYIPMFETNINAPEVRASDSDVLMARNIEGQIVQLFYSRENGFNLKIGENYLTLDSEGNIVARNNGAVMNSMAEGFKFIKEGEDTFSAAKAEPIIEMFSEFCSDLSDAAIAGNNPYLTAYAELLANASRKLHDKLQDLKSKYVTIS